MDAAEAVVRPTDETAFVLDVVSALADKSLVRVDLDRAQTAEPRFGMYRNIQEYALEKLTAMAGRCGDVQTTRRHGDYFAALGSEAAVAALDTHGGVTRRRALGAETQNILTACRRALGRHDGPAAAATCRAAWVVYAQRGPAVEAVGLATAVLGLATLSATDRARVHRVAGLAHRMAGNVAAARLDLDAALALYVTAADAQGEAVVLGNLGLLGMEAGRMAEAEVLQTRALSTHEHIHDRVGEGIALGNLAIVNRRQGRFGLAREQYTRALAIHREVGNRVNEGVVLGNLAILNGESHRPEDACSDYQAALAIHREVGNRRGEGVTLWNYGERLVLLGRLDEAQDALHAALSILRDIGNRRFEALTLGSIAMLAVRRGRLGEAADALTAAEAILRPVGDLLELGKVLCGWVEVHHLRGDERLADAALEEATTIAMQLTIKPTTEYGQLLLRVQALRG